VAGAPSVDRATTLAGVADRGDDPAVVALAAPGRPLCAGALVAPDVVVTAAACVPPSASSLQVFTGEEPADRVERARGWRLLAPVSATGDVAFVLLDAPIDDITPLAVRTTGVAKGDHVRTVGFTASGRLVRDHAAVLASNERAFDVAEASCALGGGAPAVDEATSAVVGVLLSGPANCVPDAGGDVYGRADRAVAPVAQALTNAARGTDKGAQKPHKGPIDMGAGCARAAECAAGACVSYRGGEYCSRTCSGQDACPAHFKCMNTQEEVMVCVER
jgi:hypothetical protein